MPENDHCSRELAARYWNARIRLNRSTFNRATGRAARAVELLLADVAAFASRLTAWWVRSCAVALATAVAFVPAMSVAHADCNVERVVVLGTPEERENVCRALAQVRNYFAQGGIALEFEVTIRFQSQVEATMNNRFTHTAELWPVSGYYRAGTKQLYMTRSKAPWTSERTPWRLPWDDEIGFSILEHELIHAAIAQVMGDNYRKVPNAWHEALAYAIQISLMKPDLRAKVLANFSAVRAFDSTLEINALTYEFDPDSFAVAAYKTYMKNHEFMFVRRAISFGFEMTDLTAFNPP
jgi:hypothetical protein